MNKYESVIILKPDLSKQELEKIIFKVENKIKEFAEITDKKDYGILNYWLFISFHWL